MLHWVSILRPGLRSTERHRCPTEKETICGEDFQISRWRLSIGGDVQMSRAFLVRVILLAWPLVFGLVGSCGRFPGILAVEPEEVPVATVDAAPVPEPIAVPPTRTDAAPDLMMMTPMPPAPVPGPTCMPVDEACNGVDDDCDGAVDEGQSAIPCPDGGFRYCVDGRFSECPRRCDLCVPGSERVCFIPYCTYWGVQTCAADGRSFGFCREQRAPRECDVAVKNNMRSRELEQCCVDKGYCCLDEFDLDNDGDRRESIGSCDGVSCGL